MPPLLYVCYVDCTLAPQPWCEVRRGSAGSRSPPRSGSRLPYGYPRTRCVVPYWAGLVIDGFRRPFVRRALFVTTLGGLRVAADLLLRL